MNTFLASEITIYSQPEYKDQVIFADSSVWELSQHDNGLDWGLYHPETKVRHSAIGLHRSMNDLCAAINEQDEFLRYLLRTGENSTSVHRGEHYV